MQQHVSAAELHRRPRRRSRAARGAQQPGGPIQLRRAHRAGVPGNRDLTRVNPNWNFGNGVIAKIGYSNTHSAQVEVRAALFQRPGLPVVLHVYALAHHHRLRRLHQRQRRHQRHHRPGAGSGKHPTARRAESHLRPAAAAGVLQLHQHPAAPHPLQRHLRSAVRKGKAFRQGASRALDAVIGGWQIASHRRLAQRHMAERRCGRVSVRQSGTQRRSAADADLNGRPQRLYFRGDFDPTRATNVDLQKLEALVPVDRGRAHPAPARRRLRQPPAADAGQRNRPAHFDHGYGEPRTRARSSWAREPGIPTSRCSRTSA